MPLLVLAFVAFLLWLIRTLSEPAVPDPPDLYAGEKVKEKAIGVLNVNRSLGVSGQLNNLCLTDMRLLWYPSAFPSLVSREPGDITFAEVRDVEYEMGLRHGELMVSARGQRLTFQMDPTTARKWAEYIKHSARNLSPDHGG